MLNRFMGCSAPPVVGGPATLLMFTDRHAFTVVGIEYFKSGPRKGEVRLIKATQDRAKRIDKNGMSESQEYEYTTNPDAPIKVFRATKKGFVGDGGRLVTGHRDEYYDFSF